jgi:hypothetical protein
MSIKAPQAPLFGRIELIFTDCCVSLSSSSLESGEREGSSRCQERTKKSGSTYKRTGEKRLGKATRRALCTRGVVAVASAVVVSNARRESRSLSSSLPFLFSLSLIFSPLLWVSLRFAFPSPPGRFTVSSTLARVCESSGAGELRRIAHSLLRVASAELRVS